MKFYILENKNGRILGSASVLPENAKEIPESDYILEMEKLVLEQWSPETCSKTKQTTKLKTGGP